jgi:hypothetical protein
VRRSYSYSSHYILTSESLAPWHLCRALGHEYFAHVSFALTPFHAIYWHLSPLPCDIFVPLDTNTLYVCHSYSCPSMLYLVSESLICGIFVPLGTSTSRVHHLCSCSPTLYIGIVPCLWHLCLLRHEYFAQLCLVQSFIICL